MSRTLHKIRFETSGTVTKVFLDDTEVKGCTEAIFSWTPEEIPTVWLQFMATDIKVDIDKANVIKNKEGKSDD